MFSLFQFRIMYILFEIKHFQAEKCMNSAKLCISGGKVYESDQFTHFWAKKRVNPAKSLRMPDFFYADVSAASA